MASDGQKQHLLDMELWRKDRLNLKKASEWIGRLHSVDPKALVRWFDSEGEKLAYYFFLKSIQVAVRSEDEDQDLEERFFTLDGIYYVKVLDDAQRETIENILRTMAATDPERYQNFLTMLGGVIPAELEEEMYRLKNIRLAEHGFLPREEALIAYAPLAPDQLNVETPSECNTLFSVEDNRELIPISPLHHASGRNLLTKAFSSIDDNLLLDRIRLEFAGICNQTLSADDVWPGDLDELIRSCQKSAAHLNLALEKLCGKDISMAIKLMKNNPLMSVFRVGIGLVLELKWQTEKWLKNAWFYGQGLKFSFWGDKWGNTLVGIMKKIPRFYSDFGEGEGLKDFEYVHEFDGCKKNVKAIQTLDEILERLTAACPPDKHLFDDPQLTFYHMVFNFWARQLLNLAPGFSGLSKDQIDGFFSFLRTGEKGPPYQMPGFAEAFINDFMAYAPDMEPKLKRGLEDALLTIWQEFVEEYAWVAARDLEGRFSKFVTAFIPSST